MQAERNAPKVERKYALTKVTAGDYLLPGNDGKSIWRVMRYTDGPSSGLDDWPRDRELWLIRKWTGTAVEKGSYIDLEDWDRWEHWDDGYDTRGDAIQRVVNASSEDGGT